MKQTIIALDARCIGNRKTGDTTYWTGLVSGLQQSKSDLSYLLCSNAPCPPEIPESEKIRWVELRAMSDRLWSLVAFPVAARRMGASLVHTQYNLSPLAKAGVTTIHDVSFFVGPEWFRPRDRFLLQRFVPQSARRARRVITVSQTSKRDIARFIPDVKSKIDVTPLACSPSIHRVSNPKLSRLEIDGPYLLTVGTRWPRKNMTLAMDAAELLPAEIPHKLVVTGQSGWGNERPGKRTLCVGWVSEEELCALYSGAELYLAPSRYEGFGLTVLEAFVCGCPVLCSTGGALPEVAGDAAKVESSWQPQGWADAILNLLRDSSKLSEMRQRGPERARHFSWQRTATLTEAVYREALA